MDQIMSLLEGFDLAKLLPNLEKFFTDLRTWISIALMAGPLALLIVGVIYLLLPPKQANHRMGFRSPFGMGSVPAWRFTQKVAGIVWGLLGAVLLIWMSIRVKSICTLEVMDCAVGAVRLLFTQAVTVGIVWLLLHIVPIVFFSWKGEPRFTFPARTPAADAPVREKPGLKLFRRSEALKQEPEEPAGPPLPLEPEPSQEPELPQEPEPSQEPEEPPIEEQISESIRSLEDEDIIFPEKR